MFVMRMIMMMVRLDSSSVCDEDDNEDGEAGQ